MASIALSIDSSTEAFSSYKKTCLKNMAAERINLITGILKVVLFNLHQKYYVLITKVMRGFRQICCKHKVLTEAVGVIVELAEGCPIYF